MTATPTATAPRIAFIQASWHEDIVEQALKSFLAELKDNGVSSDSVEVFNVPGSLEIPLQAKMLALSGRYSLIVGAGFVINGGIYRHDFVASAVINGIMQVQLETQVPILSVVLTPLNFHEHETHHQFFFEHFKEKGREAARAAIATLRNMERIGELQATA